MPTPAPDGPLEAAAVSMAIAAPSGEAVPRKPHGRRWVRWSATLLICSFVLLGGLALANRMLVKRPPLWWGVVDPLDPQTRRAAQSLQNAVVSAAHEPRQAARAGATLNQGGEWTLAISQADANAWLNTMLEEWLENRAEDEPDGGGGGGRGAWPEGIGQVRVRFGDGWVDVGAEIEPGGRSTGLPSSPGSRRIVWARIRPEIHGDGSLWLRATDVAVGRVGVPASWLETGGGVLSWLLPEGSLDLRGAAAGADVILGRAAALDDPVVKLGDGRLVRLVDLRAVEGVLTVVCRTVPPAVRGE